MTVFVPQMLVFLIFFFLSHLTVEDKTLLWIYNDFRIKVSLPFLSLPLSVCVCVRAVETEGGGVEPCAYPCWWPSRGSCLIAVVTMAGWGMDDWGGWTRWGEKRLDTRLSIRIDGRGSLGRNV